MQVIIWLGMYHLKKEIYSYFRLPLSFLEIACPLTPPLSSRYLSIHLNKGHQTGKKHRVINSTYQVYVNMIWGCADCSWLQLSLQAGFHSWQWLQDHRSHPPNRLHCRQSWYCRFHRSHDVVPHVDALTAEANFGFWAPVKSLAGYVRFSDHGSLTIGIQVYKS